MPYRFLEDIATGDAAFEAEGRTLEELFVEAAVTTFEVMVDTKAVLFCKFNVNIKKNDAYELKARASGENINQQKHSLRSDVKAVTFHMFEVKKTEENWSARVILDI